MLHLASDVRAKSPSFSKAEAISRSMSVLFLSRARSLAAMTMRKPVRRGLSRIKERRPSRRMRLTRLRVTASPSFLETVSPMRLILVFWGFCLRKSSAFRSGKTYIATEGVTARFPFEYALEYRCSSLGASSLKNFSAVCSSHSLSETVLHLSLSFLRLVGSFHEWHLLYSFRWALRGLNASFRAYSYKDILYYTEKNILCQVFLRKKWKKTRKNPRPSDGRGKSRIFKEISNPWHGYGGGRRRKR